MTISVTDRAKTIATFRYIAVMLMETIAAWTPATPEMEVKVMFGRHIWEFAQHADALGKRTFELRQPEHYTLRPSPEYLKLLDAVASMKTTAERLSSMYDALIPALERRYLAYAESSDAILDGPSIVIIDRIVRDYRRMMDDAKTLRARRSIASAGAHDFRSREASVTSLVAG